MKEKANEQEEGAKHRGKEQEEMVAGGWNIVFVKWGTERAADGAGSRNERYTRPTGGKPGARGSGQSYTFFFIY